MLVDDIPEEDASRKKKKRRKKHYFLKFLVVVAVGTGLYFLLNSALFDIRTISVANNAYYTAEQVIEKSGMHTGENIFWIELGKAKKRLLSDPYVKNAELKRSFPSEINILIEERTESAAILDGHEYILIDEDGMVLRKTETEPTITLLRGMHVLTAKEGMALEVEENAAFKDTLDLLKEIQKYELYFKKIDVSNIILRAYIYDQFVCEGTPENFMNNLDSLKQVLFYSHTQNIERGMIKIGGDGHLAWQPVTELSDSEMQEQYDPDSDLYMDQSDIESGAEGMDEGVPDDGIAD